MGDKSAIEWTDATLNVVTGCTKVSPACASCYIESTPPFRIAGRKFVKGNIPLVFHEDRLLLPLQWKRPRKIFVNSLSDLFHEDVPDAFLDKVFAMMALAKQHVFQILTKRPERMLAYVGQPTNVNDLLEDAGYLRQPHETPWPLPNVWLGCSVENQHWADVRIPKLLRTPAAVRFISAEPLLGLVDLGAYLYEGIIPRPGLDWVIGGFESGARRRDGNVDHARYLRDQCRKAGVAFMWKQNGGRTSKAGGRLLDGRTHDEYPSAKQR